jgi:hypothetical protein
MFLIFEIEKYLLHGKLRRGDLHQVLPRVHRCHKTILYALLVGIIEPCNIPAELVYGASYEFQNKSKIFP